MKKLLFVMLIAVFIFAGCDSKGAGIPVTGEWILITDEGNGGTSTIEVEEVQKDGKTAYRFFGEVLDDYYDYGYAGWEILPDEATLEALKTAKGISFKFLGQGEKFIVKFRVSDVQDWAHHEYVFDTEDGKEITVEVPINLFMQPAWGTEIGPVSRYLNNAYSLSWQTHEEWRPDVFDVTIWDVRIMQ